MAFDVLTPTRLGGGAIGVLQTTLRTVPEDSVDLVKNMDITNTTGADLNVTVWLVPNDEDPSDASVLIPDVAISGNTIFQWTGSQVIDAGARIVAISNGTGVNMVISGANGVTNGT